jgi:hypothetical protein
VHVRSDQERKRLYGVRGETRLPKSAYRQDVSATVYRMCRKRALMALAGARTVILDAVHAKPEERDASAKLAAQMGAAFTGIWLEAPPATMRQRIESRMNDISDATVDVLDEQLSYDLGPQSFAVVDAGRPLAEVVADCHRILS